MGEKKAVLFDLWGTLLQQGAYSPLKQTYRILRVPLQFGDFVEKFERATMTRDFDDQKTLFVEAFKTFNLEPKDFLIDRLIGIWNKNKLLARLYPETVETLQLLKDRGIKLGLVSNTPKFSVDQFDKFGITDYFDAIAFSWQVGHLKTDKELFQHALDELGVSAGEAVMVGDSLQTDIAGAENAGVLPVLIDRKDRRNYERKITNLKQVEQFLG